MEIFIPLAICIILLFIAFGLGAWAIIYQGARNEKGSEELRKRGIQQ